MADKRDFDKAKELSTLNADAVIDLRVVDANASRCFVVAHTPANKQPAFVALAALLCVNGAVRLHEFDTLVARWNAIAPMHAIDSTNDNIIRSMHALLDVSWYDAKQQVMHKQMNVTNDPTYWLEWLKQWSPTLDMKLFNLAKTVKHEQFAF